ncbi:MAG: cytochrome c3 family protein [Nitrospirota bacterium]
MRFAKTSIIIMAAIAVVFGLGSVSYAFHEGGVGRCEGCHDMHNSKSTGMLLKGTDTSSTCLSCHAAADTAPNGYHVMTYPVPGAGIPPANMGPGGDFAWLGKTYTWIGRSGKTSTEKGDSHGHNIIAADYGMVTDATNSGTAPGGTFPSSQFACISCHDQHGTARRLNDGTYSRDGGPIIASGSYASSPIPPVGEAVGTYRLLRGSMNDRNPGNTNYATPALAFAPDSYNRSESYTQTRVAFGDRMSDFCGACHTNHHTTNVKYHPQGVSIRSTVAGNYNAYIASGNMGGSSASSYLSLVPFEEGATTDIATLQTHAVSDNSVLAGPDAASQVMCLSCHRGHASAFPAMARWNNESELITFEHSYAGTDAPNAEASNANFARGRLVAEMAAGYYNKPATDFATFQRSLCNKCHAKD